MLDFVTYTPTRIIVGPNRLKEIGKISSSYGRKALLVTGRRSMKEAGFTQEVTDLLRKEGMSVDVYDRAGTNPERKDGCCTFDVLEREIESQPPCINGKNEEESPHIMFDSRGQHLRRCRQQFPPVSACSLPADLSATARDHLPPRPIGPPAVMERDNS